MSSYMKAESRADVGKVSGDKSEYLSMLSGRGEVVRNSDIQTYIPVPSDLIAFQKYKKLLMKDDIINNSNKIINGADLWDQKAIDILTKNDTDINDWWKMESKHSYATEFGEGKIHFYQNVKTGEISSFDSKLKIPKPKNLRNNPKDLFWIIDLDENFIPVKLR